MEKEFVTLCAKTIKEVKIMQEMIENRMLVDLEWDEIEYRVPSKARLKRIRQAYEEAERDGMENESRR